MVRQLDVRSAASRHSRPTHEHSNASVEAVLPFAMRATSNRRLLRDLANLVEVSAVHEDCVDR